MDQRANHYTNRPKIVAAKATLLATVTIGLFPFVTQQAAAQTTSETVSETAADNPNEGLGQIVVTARRRAESLQDVPVTVTSVGGETLEAFGVTNVDKLVSRVPSLNIQQGGALGGASLSLRGVGTANLSPSFDSAVALDFDGVQIGQLRILQAGFFDAEQVDVLKGPQSLYFGKSASAGVLTIRSAGPTDEWEVGAKAGYETEEKGYIGEVYISGPISDTLGVRLAARYNEIDELVLNDFPGVANPARGSEDLYVRGTLNWAPTAEFTADLKVNYISNERDGSLINQDLDCGPDGVADNVEFLGGAVILPAGYNCNLGDGRYSYVDPDPAVLVSVPAQYRATAVPFHDTDIWLGRLKMDLDVSDRITLTSMSGYYSLDTEELDAFSYGGIGPNNEQLGQGMGQAIIANEQFSQEFRLTASDFGPFTFTLGAFYEYRDFDFDSTLFIIPIGLVAPDPVTGFTADAAKEQNVKSEAFSVFFNSDIEFTDQLTLSAGIRYTDESKDGTVAVPFVHTFLQGPGSVFAPQGFFTSNVGFDDDNFSPEVSLNYRVSDDVSVFGAYKTGFKSGGIDTSILPTVSLEVSRQAGDFSSLNFDSEESEGFEVGVKSELFGRSLRLNATAYRYVFSDLQVQLFDAAAIQFNVLNASEITTTGVDVDFQWLSPIDGLTFSGALAYLDARYTEDFFPLGPTGDNLRGRASRNAPEFSGNAAFDYRVPVGELDFILNGNVNYSGSYFFADERLNDPVQSDYFTFDAAVSIGSADDRWKLSLAAVNIGNELFASSVTDRPFRPIADGDDRVVSFNRGRQVFIEAAFKF